MYLRKIPEVGCTQRDVERIKKILDGQCWWSRIRAIWDVVFSPSSWVLVASAISICVMYAFYPRFGIAAYAMGRVCGYTQK
jgi:hypothetical protein